MDAGGAADESATLRTAKSCGPDASMVGVKSAELSAGDGDNKARSPGRARRKPLKPSRAGMPGDPGATVVTNARVYYTPRAAAGATGTRHSPRPLWAKGSCTTRARRAAGMRRCILPSLPATNAKRLCNGAKATTQSILSSWLGLLRCARKDGVDGPRRHQCARLVMSIRPDKGAVHERD